MNNEEKIQKLIEFKEALLKWFNSSSDERSAELRSYINQNIMWARREVIEAGCFYTVTIGPPPIVGGLIHKDADLFRIIFEAPYGRSPVPNVVDMIDQTIGVLSAPIEKENKGSAPTIQQNIQRNYAFIAMAIDPDDRGLEDVLHAIKRAASKYEIQAERVDEDQFNERITDRILESIGKAEFVIVDLTKSKPNVYYEAGYAQGINKTPIYIARYGQDIAFDLKDYPVIFFKNMTQLEDELENRLRALIERRDRNA